MFWKNTLISSEQKINDAKCVDFLIKHIFSS